ncbi:MAG: hypothetical protein ACRCXL_13975, partial [Dermatophilaceae bacterium]
MGYNVTLSVLPDTRLEEVTTADPSSTVEEALSSQNDEPLATQVGSAVLVVDPGAEVTHRLAERLDRQAYRVTIGDTADVYAVEAFGAHRRLL